MTKYLHIYYITQVFSIGCMFFAVYLSFITNIQLSTHFVALAIFLQLTAGEPPSRWDRKMEEYTDRVL